MRVQRGAQSDRLSCYRKSVPFTLNVIGSVSDTGEPPLVFILSLLDADTVSVQPVAEATTDPGVAELVLVPTLRADPLDGLQIVNTGTVSVNTSGFTVKVAVPVLPDPVTMNVSLLPTTAGVTLTPVSWPEVNVAEGPGDPRRATIRHRAGEARHRVVTDILRC